MELGVNYITHLYTIAKAGFTDEEYYRKHAQSIPVQDREFLQSQARLLFFSRKDHGIFASRLYFLPAYFNPQTFAVFNDIYTALYRAGLRPAEMYQAGVKEYLKRLNAPTRKNTEGLE